MPEAKIRVVVADDHLLIRRGICALLAEHDDIELLGEAEDGQQAIDLYRALRPDLLLLDLRMPRIDGCEAIERIRQEFPSARILILTTYAKDAQAFAALHAGALGYILKSDLHCEIIHAIRSVYAGKQYLNSEVAAAMARHEGDHRLTDRECSVLRLAAAGNSNKRIAASLSLSEETIKGYMKIILGKLEAIDRTQAVTIAARRGILEL